jgi:hypothetical protein
MRSSDIGWIQCYTEIKYVFHRWCMGYSKYEHKTARITDWCLINPHAVQEVSLQTLKSKARVWCAVSAHKIIGFMFFEGTVYCDHHI